MKKKILFCILALAVIYQANAQEKAFNIGLRMAPAIAWLGIDDNNIESDGAVFKCNWALFGAWNFAENFSVVSGFNVNFLGGKYKHKLLEGPNVTVTNRIRLNEFQIPLGFQMRTDEVSGFKFYAQVGLAGGYIFRAKDEDNKNVDNRSLNTSYFVAAGAEYPIDGGISLIGQLKFNGGLTSVMSKNRFASTQANFIELGFGVMF